MESKSFEITWNSLWRILFFAVFLVFLYAVRQILVLLILAIVISLVCQPAVDFLQKKKINRSLATTFIYVLILIILGVFLWFVVPLVIAQLGHFITNFNELVTKIGNQGFFGELTRQLLLNLKAVFDALAGGANKIFSIIFSVFGGLLFALTCVVLAFYFNVEEKGVEIFFRSVLPKAYENQVIAVFERATLRIGRWFHARIALSVIMGLLTWLGLILLGIKYSGTLALLTAVLDIVPFIGPIFAGLIACLAALTESSWLSAVWVLLFFVVLQQLEAVLFTPLIMKKSTGLPSLVVLIALIIGSKIGGLMGFVLAIPVAIIIQEIYGESAPKKASA